MKNQLFSAGYLNRQINHVKGKQNYRIIYFRYQKHMTMMNGHKSHDMSVAKKKDLLKSRKSKYYFGSNQKKIAQSFIVTKMNA